MFTYYAYLHDSNYRAKLGRLSTQLNKGFSLKTMNMLDIKPKHLQFGEIDTNHNISGHRFEPRCEKTYVRGQRPGPIHRQGCTDIEDGLRFEISDS